MIVKKEEKEARLRTAHTLLDNISIFSDGMCRNRKFKFKIGEDMKQTSKLTRNQRHFLESRGIKDTTNLRFCKEDKHVFVYFNKEDGKVYSINK